MFPSRAAVQRIGVVLFVVLTSACRGQEPPAAPGVPPPPAATAPTPTPGAPPAVVAPPPGPDTLARSVHVALGVPADADDRDDWLMDKELFAVSYNPRLNAPNWVAWNLDEAYLGRVPRTPKFHSDTSLPREFYMVRDEDYTHSGYDRGHLCPSADRSLTPVMNAATFVLTNAHPQFHELNGGPWEQLEVHERELARSGKELYIVAGGLFDAEPPRIGPRPEAAQRVAVPRASYKVIVVLERGQGLAAVRPDTRAIAVIMPNTREVSRRDWKDFVVSVRAVEQASGYDFHRLVPRDVQDAFESRMQ